MATTTYTEHSPTYYTIRSTVRFVFWSLIFTTTLMLIGKGLNAVSVKDTTPVCQVTVNRDFTWTWNQTPVALTECKSPEGVILEQGNTWEWYDPYING